MKLGEELGGWEASIGCEEGVIQWGMWLREWGIEDEGIRWEFRLGGLERGGLWRRRRKLGVYICVLLHAKEE